VQAVRQGVPYLVAPCCVGKIKFAGGASAQPEGQQEGGSWADGRSGLGYINKLQLETEGSWTRIQYPRSRWLTQQMAGVGEAQALFAEIAASADFSEMHGGARGREEGGKRVLGTEGVSEKDTALFRSCAIVVGLDRNEFAREAGYEVRLRTMPGLGGSGKADLLLGWVKGK
jgi:hypothetical protein